MNTLCHRFSLLLALFAGALLILMVSQVYAATPVAKVSSFSGEAVIQSDTSIRKISQIGQPLNKGDIIQTKNGQVQVTFVDGALLKVRPYTNVQVQERKEKSGFWVFKEEKPVRRITCFVGKLWFKSGSSNKKNYLQSPTAVCALQGSDGDFGYDNVNTYLNMYSGDAAVTGKVLREFFEDPGIDAATKNRVYKSLEGAHKTAEEAQASGDPVEQAKARVEAVQVVKAAAGELKNNPDPAVKEEAKIVDAAADASLAAAEAEVSKEEANKTAEAAEEAKAAAEAEKKKAEEAMDEEAVKAAEEKAQAAEKAAKEAEKAAEKAEKAAEKAKKAEEKAKQAADQGNEKAVQDAAKEAEKAAEESKEAKEEAEEKTKDVVTTTEETTAETTEEATTSETTAETTAETTTAETTTAETTTAETTSSTSSSTSSTTSSTSTTTTTSEETTVSPSS